MKDLIVNSLELICKILIVLIVGVCTVGSWIMIGNPFITIAALILSFVACVFVFGVLFLLIDLNDNMRQLRYIVEKNSEPPQPDLRQLPNYK